MRKLLFIIPVLLLLAGCGPSKAELEAAAAKAVAQANDTTVTASVDSSNVKIEKVLQILKSDGSGGGTLRFITAEDHQYIQWYNDDGVGSMCHNENCTNPVHKH